MSATFDDRPARGETYAGTWRAVVATNAGDVDEEVMVTIPALGSGHQFGPCKWMPRGDSLTFPGRGDEALISFDELNRPWILVWWPLS